MPGSSAGILSTTRPAPRLRLAEAVQSRIRFLQPCSFGKSIIRQSIWQVTPPRMAAARCESKISSDRNRRLGILDLEIFENLRDGFGDTQLVGAQFDFRGGGRFVRSRDAGKLLD